MRKMWDSPAPSHPWRSNENAFPKTSNILRNQKYAADLEYACVLQDELPVTLPVREDGLISGYLGPGGVYAEGLSE